MKAKVSLAGARVSAGLTQEQLAEKMGVSRQTVIDWESGKREMRTVYLHLFCTVTKFAEDDIFLPVRST